MDKDFLDFSQQQRDLSDIAKQREKKYAALAQQALYELEWHAKPLGISIEELVHRIANDHPDGQQICDIEVTGDPPKERRITLADKVRRILADLRKIGDRLEVTEDAPSEHRIITEKVRQVLAAIQKIEDRPK